MRATEDLSGIAGLPLALDLETGELCLGDGVASETPAVRVLDELRPVLADEGAEGPELPYRLYRGVRKRQDEAALGEAGLRYDVTVTLPGILGREFVKTSGHYHLRSPEGPTYPEVYEVLHGRAAFVLQRVDDPEADVPTVREMWVAVCEAGEKILIPPDCGHVSVNVGETPLVVADLVSPASGHAYGSFREARGAAWYVIADPTAPLGIRCEPNPSYGGAPEPEILTGSRWRPFAEDRGPVYAHFLERPADYTYLSVFGDRVDEMYAPWRR